MTDFGFIPGFHPALRRSPSTLVARAQLVRAVGAGRYPERIRAQIALVIAQQSQCEYCVWAQSRVARAAGLSWEDVALACAGTALDPREAAIVKLARRIALSGCFMPSEACDLPRGPLLGTDDVLEILANTSLAMLETLVIQGLAPASERASP